MFRLRKKFHHTRPTQARRDAALPGQVRRELDSGVYVAGYMRSPKQLRTK